MGLDRPSRGTSNPSMKPTHTLRLDPDRADVKFSSLSGYGCRSVIKFSSGSEFGSGSEKSIFVYK